MVDGLEKQWGGHYKPALHDEIVKELVRSEMMSFNYEQLLANGNETELTPNLLRQERTNISTLRDKLLVSLKEVKKEEPPAKEDKDASVFSLLDQAQANDPKEMNK